MKQIFDLYRCIGRKFKTKDIAQGATSKTTRVWVAFNEENNTLLPVEFGGKAVATAANIEARNEISQTMKIEALPFINELGKDIEINPNKLPWLRDEGYREDWIEDSMQEQYMEEDGTGSVRQAIKATLTNATKKTEWADIRDAINMIDLEDIDTTIAFNSLEELNKIGIFSEYTMGVKNRKLYKSRLYGELKETVWVPQFIKQDYIAEHSYKDEAIRAVSRLTDWFANYGDSLPLVEQLTFGKLGTIDENSNGWDIIEAKDILFKNIRKMVSNEWATAISASEISSKALEELEVILQESINDITEAQFIGLEISDSMKLNPITDDEFLEHVFMQGYEYIQWRKYTPKK